MIWPGFLAGLGIGALMVTLFWFTNKQLGVSTAYGLACRALPRSEMFRRGEFGADGRWRIWFIGGIPFGAILAALSSPEISVGITTSMGAYYDAVLPQAWWAKGLVLLCAGVLMGLGARMAGGCTSGHVISGVSLLNPASLVAGALFFVGGILAVQFLFFGVQGG
jgi:hypothetical protein